MPSPPAFPPYDGPTADVGVIGGSGLYRLLEDAEEVRVPTPYGDPSDVLTVGTLGGRRTAFVPRHGRDHRFPPHRVPYRANVWALRRVGVRQVLAPCAVGSLDPAVGPGTLVVPDQVVDRTWGRAHTFADSDDGVVHVGFADPYCPDGRRRAVAAAQEHRLGPVVDGGTLVVVNGPRFSSRAESRWHAAQGWSLVGMTGMPEASLAREMALCYTAVALVTDLDVGVGEDDAVTHQAVLEAFAANLDRVRRLLHALVPELPVERSGCACGEVHAGVRPPFPLP